MAPGCKLKTSSTDLGASSGMCLPFLEHALTSGLWERAWGHRAGWATWRASPNQTASQQIGLAMELLLERSGVMYSSSRDSRYCGSPFTWTLQHFRLGKIQTGVRLKFIFAVFTQKDLKKLAGSVNMDNYNISGEV